MNNRYVAIEGTKYVRDLESGAILNTNKMEIDNYNVMRDIKKIEQIEKEQVKNKLNSLESDIQEIKSMLSELIKKRIANDDH